MTERPAGGLIMQAWFGFYAVVGGAAATLIGLLFVVVSINAAVILNEAHGHSRRLAEQAFQNYVAVLSVSMLALFPSMSLSEFSFVTLLVTAVSGIWVLVRVYLALTKPHDTVSRMHALRPQVFSLLGFGMLIFAAVRMASEMGDNRNLLAASMVVLLLAATRVSWALLLRIGEVKLAGPSR
jgi:hypothetical protein